MCLIAFAINQHAHYPLIILANRDEFFDRPTEPLSQWADLPGITGGRDLKAGGTWLAINSAGKWAALTNFRNPGEQPKARSRGELIVRYLSDTGNSEDNVEQFIEALESEHQQYNGFNLVLGELQSPNNYFISNHPWSCNKLSDGTYAVSNGPINDNWPKMNTFHKGITELLQQDPSDFEKALSLMTGSIPIQDDALPDTGISRDMERTLAQPFIEPFNTSNGLYGTRSSAMVLAQPNDKASSEIDTSQTSTLSWRFVEYQHQSKSATSLTCPIKLSNS